MSAKFVYFIRPVGMNGPVKVGCSYAPIKRLEQLAVWSPIPLEVAATVPGDIELESNIHQCFADLHSHHEWFRADPRITTVIEKLQAGDPIEKAMDLSARVGTIRTKSNRWATPEGRLRASYGMKLHWAERRARTDQLYHTLPDDVSAIIARWRGYGYLDGKHCSFEPTQPTPEELRRLDEVIAGPHIHLVPHPRRARAA